VAFDKHSKAILTRRDLGRFEGETLFDRVARVVARAECLPRKELYESWEVARRVRRRMRGGRVVELAAGHGLVAWLLLLLDDTSERALAIDAIEPPSAQTLAEATVAEWPRLCGRVERRTMSLDSVLLDASDLVVSVHACGALTDRVLSLAMEARARRCLAVLSRRGQLRRRRPYGLSPAPVRRGCNTRRTPPCGGARGAHTDDSR
jgi:hypothetical protein